MEKYVLEALCQMEEYTKAEERMEYRYAEMVNGENAKTTFGSIGTILGEQQTMVGQVDHLS